jgi:splicing factor, arginine/serine-rich 17
MQTIQNASDLLQLYAPLNLFLKPQANVSITITLPLSVGTSAKAVSNFDVMDKLRQMVLPDSFSLLKVSLG